MNPVLNSGVLPVGDIDWTQYDKTTCCTDSVIDYYTANNLQQIVYEAYAKASLGDAFVRYSHVDAPDGSIAGHTYMITSSSSHVAKNSDGTIDPVNSYFMLTGQNNAIRNRTINDVVYQTSWDIGLKLTFADLYAGKYLPVTCRELLYGTIGVTDEMHDAPTSTDLGYGNLYGTLESNYTMLSVTLSVKNSSGTVVKSATAYPYSKTFHLVELSDDLDLDSLSSGDYTFVVSYKAGFASSAGNTTSVAEHVAMEKGFVRDTDMVIYISNENTANGDGSGKDADNPMWDDLKTGASYGNTLNAGRTQETALHRAWEECIAAGGGTIVFIDHYTISTSMCTYQNGWSNADMKYLGTGYTPSDIKITYTSVYGGKDYRTTNGAMVDLIQRTHINFPTATYTENITFNSPDSREAAGNTPETYLCGNCTTLHLGENTKFARAGNAAGFWILGGPRINGTNANGSNIILDIGNENSVNNIYGLSFGANDHSGDSNITILSGTVLNDVYGDGVQVGTTGDVNITVSGGVVKGTIYAVDAGFADTNGSVNITVTGGTVNGIEVSDGDLTNATHYLPANSTLDLSALEEEDRLAILDTAGAGFSYDIPLVIFVSDEFGVLGGVRSNGAATSGSTNVIVDIGDTNNIGNIYGLSYGGTAHTGDSRITVNSGIVHGNIAGDGVVPTQVGINGHVYITVNGGTLYGNIYGVTEGFVNADGTVTVNINGGKIVENEDPLRIFVTDGIDGLLYNAPVSITNAKLNIDYDKVDGLTAAIVKEQHTNSTTDPSKAYGWFAYTPTGEQAVICTVTYQDTVDPANKVTVEIKELNPTLPTWTKSGYTFTGWWVDNANGGDFVAGGKTFAPRKNITLYTVWDGYYTISIPDILYINNNTSYITADLDNAPGRATLIIDIETLHNFRLQLTAEHSVYVPYKLRWDGGEVSSNGAAVDISLTGTSDKQIYGVLTGDIPYAGIYQDPITYTITYDSDAISHSVFPASFLNP